jgi:hypothetical protein
LGICIIELTPAPLSHQFRASGTAAYQKNFLSLAQHPLSGQAATTFQWSGRQRIFPRQNKKFRNWNRERAGKSIQDIHGWVFLLALQASISKASRSCERPRFTLTRKEGNQSFGFTRDLRLPDNLALRVHNAHAREFQ